MRQVLVRTFGCKLNQYDSQLITESFARSGYGIAKDPSTADVWVVNTCSVTARSDYQARQLVRRAVRSGTKPLVVVTGCYSQRAPEELARIEGVGLVTGNVEKASLPRLVDGLTPGELARTVVSPPDEEGCAAGCGPEFQRRARALVKVQVGCDSSCSYCVVPSVRGKSRSVRARDVLREVAAVTERGYTEVVLTGARVGSYRDVTAGGLSLSGLVEALVDAGTGFRIRLSSLEPAEVSQSLLEAAGGDRVCPHFHVPLQSGDDGILRAMGRPYSASEYAERIRWVVEALPHACVGADVIAGFPGETEARFARTYGLVERLPLAYLHVFPFSGRPGTAAVRMKGEVPGVVKKARVRALMELSETKRREFALSRAGSYETAVLEQQNEDGSWTATTGNYLKVRVQSAGRAAGEAVRVKIGSLSEGRLAAEEC
ncbi:MAG: tRNA (N(6)-L-threonylcarbamoyladenosine(37)-C(2))-methylthiotransferase MtaB [Candidatus Eisenbacteria bacterium]|nr:tRNA (N(6)-L-threonylcarbamoyladenosine(37)-C(2))-methylthiotransferase MtaB [Candidatus Eisenbacteria bacterium]